MLVFESESASASGLRSVALSPSRSALVSASQLESIPVFESVAVSAVLVSLLSSILAAASVLVALSAVNRQAGPNWESESESAPALSNCHIR